MAPLAPRVRVARIFCPRGKRSSSTYDNVLRAAGIVGYREGEAILTVIPKLAPRARKAGKRTRRSR